MSTFTISGKVIRQANGQPIPKVYIEAWDKNPDVKIQVAATITDESGAFTMHLNSNYVGEIYKDQLPDIYFKVYAENLLIANTGNSLVVNLRGNVSDLAVPVDYNGAVHQKGTTYRIKGQILQKNYLPAAGYEVDICDHGVVNDTVLTQVHTDEVGYFETSVNSELIERAGKQSPDLFLRIAVNKDVKHVTDTVYNAPSLHEFKVVIGGAAFPAESEFERVNKKLSGLLRNVPVNEIVQTPDKNPYRLLAEKTGHDETQVKWTVVSQQLAAATQMPSAFFYALLRGQLVPEYVISSAAFVGQHPGDLIAMLRSVDNNPQAGQNFIAIAQQPQAILRALSLLPEETVPNAFDFATANRLIPAQLVAQRDELLRQWSTVVTHTQEQRRQEMEQLMANARFDDNGKKIAENMLNDQKSSIHDVIASLEKEASATAAVTTLKTVVAINDVVNDPQTASRIQSQLRINQPQDVSRLAGLSSQEWQGLLSGNASEGKIRNMQNTLEKRYPTASFAGKLKVDGANGFVAKEPLLDFFDSYPEVELHQTNINSFFSKNSDALKAKFQNTDALKTDLKKIQRVFRLAPDYGTTKALLEKNITSSQGIYTMGKARFAETMSGTLTPEVADSIYRKAERSYATTLAIIGEIKSMQNGSALNVLPSVYEALDAVAMKDFPDLKTLFLATDDCECKDCKNVYSPSAYLADLLKFLNKRGSTTPMQSAKQVLFKRRPDIGEIDLNCDNSQTAIPYIDLVCEILEDTLSTTSIVLSSAIEPQLTEGVLQAAVYNEFKSKNLEIDSRAAVTLYNATTWFVRDDLHTYKIQKSAGQLLASVIRQTHGTAAERKAIPEYINYAVYDTILRNEKHPFALPFDLSWEETRAYLDKLGVDRAEWMEAFENTVAGTPTQVQIAGEFLGIAPAERQLIVTADPMNQALYWGNLAGIDTVSVFLQRSGLEYKQLLYLLDLKFINPTLDSKVVHHDATANLDNKNISNLDHDKLDRMHRFLRLWRKTNWQLWELDKVIMNTAIGNGLLNEACLVNLRSLMLLKLALNKPVEELVAYFENLNTKGTGALYNSLFRSRILLDPLPDAFRLDLVTENPFPNPAPAAPDGTLRTITAQLKPLAAVLKLTNEEAALIQARALANDQLSLDNISIFHRIASLTRKIRMSVQEYYVLLDILNTGAVFNVFADATTVRSFIDTAALLRTSGFSVYELAYLLLHKDQGPRAQIPADDQITVFLTKGRSALQKINDDLNSLSGQPDEKAKALIGKITAIDDSAANETVQIFGGTFTGTTAARDAFLDASYGPFIPTATLKTKLNDRDAALPADRDQKTLDAWQELVNLLAAYLVRQLSQQAVHQLHEDNFRFTADVSTLMLDKGHLKGVADPLMSYWFDPNFLAKNNAGNYVNAINVANFPRLFQSYQLLNKVALLQSKLPVNIDLMTLLAGNAAVLGVLAYDQLPVGPGAVSSQMDQWKAYIQLQQFATTYPDNDAGSLASVLTLALPLAAAENDFMNALAAYTYWDVNELTALKTQTGLVYPADFLKPSTYARLDRLFNLMLTPNLKAAQVPLAINAAPAAADAIAVKQLVKSKYDNAQWLNTSANIQDVIRQKKRDALVAYFTNNTISGNNFKDADALYSFYLLDTEMSAKEVTARVLQANLSIQLFVQRCLMNLEAEIVADAAQDDGWLQWEWMKYYQVWAANRKVFLYPENWIEPELRPDKSVFFQELENQLMQNEVNKDNVEQACLGYLEKLDNVARLDVNGYYYEEETYTLHVFARTYDDPHIYYYRKWVEDRYWTPWEKVDLEITTTQVVPVVINRRIYLYWPEFREQTLQPTSTSAPNPGQSNFAIDQPYKQWEIHLAVSEFRNNKWTPKKVSKTAITTGYTRDLYNEYAQENFTFLPIDMMDIADRYLIGCYLNTSPDDETSYYSEPFDYFDLGSCHGTPEVLDDYRLESLIDNPVIPQMERSELRFLESQEATSSPNDALAFQQGSLFINHVHILEKTPGWFKAPQSAQLSFFDKLLLKIYWNYLYGAKQNAAREYRLPHPVGTFLPFFYQDKGRTFFVPQEIVLTKRIRGDKKPLRGEFFYSDILKIVQEIMRTGQLPDILKPYFDDGRWPQVSYKLKFSNFYHPYVCFLIKQLYRNGLDGMMRRDVQMLNHTQFPEIQQLDFATTYSPTWVVNSADTRVVANPADPDTTVTPGYPKETLDFNAWGSYAEYNWELFYHLPMLIAQKLSNNQQFEDAMHWYHYIFNPTDASAYTSPQRFWNTKPFFLRTNQDYLNQRIDQILNMIDSGDTELIKDVDDWRRNPFQPHRIAQFRTVAYQKNTVMKYLDNLIAWGDNLFRSDTRENITAAAQLYILAGEILGPKPKVIPNFFEPPVLNYNQLETRLDAFSNAMVEVENFIPYFTDDVQTFDNGGGPLPAIDIFYFCLPANDKLLGYWNTIADRLFKIRYSMNIDGIERSLALYDPPIDPGLLVKAAASGLSLGAAISGLNAPLPNYRFSVCLQKANDFCNEVKALGSLLLSALEKRDSEALALLRSSQEIRMYEAVKLVKKAQLDEANANIEQLNRTLAVTQEKLNYYSGLSYMNTGETVAFALSTASTILDAAIAAGYILAGGLKAIPQFVAGASGFGGSPHVTIDIGGQEFGDAAEIATKTISAIALALDKGASLASTQAGYQRRKDEWDYQVRASQKEIAQIEQQITAAQIRLDIAQKELDNQQLQIDQAHETNQFMRSKFTSQQLYEWMITQISSVYFQSYQLAFDLSRRAERCYQYELGTSDSNFIQYGYWDSLKKGLLAGEKLMVDLKRLDASYYDKNKREFEITRHVSLSQLDPMALLKLKQNGVCFLNLPEELFDMDYPGHYFRRLKSVAVSIPCIVGPYNNVNCTLTILKSRIRISSDAANVDYSTPPADNDPGFTFNFSSIQQMVTSTAQNDSGMFDTNLHDERYLTFEGHGAISQWKLEVNKDFKSFDLNSISDVILHVRYTARQGGAVLASKVKTELTSHFDQIIKTYEDGTGFFKLLSMKTDFSTEFYQLMHPAGASQDVTFNITSSHVPYWLGIRNSLPVDSAVPVTVWLKPKVGATINLPTLNMKMNGQPVNFAPPSSLGELKQGTTAQAGELIGGWQIGSTTASLDPSKIDDILVLIKYKAV